MVLTNEKSKESIEINLARGLHGLGFNIRGGKDQAWLPNDDGIFVTKIRDQGSAAKDGRLQEGDKIIEINGHSLIGVTHAEAVDHFLKAEENIRLLVWQGAESALMEEFARKQKESKGTNSSSPYNKTVFILAGIVVTIVVAVYIWRSPK